MKKVLFFIILILSLNIVSAGMGKTIPLDFNLRDDYIVPMYVSDRVAFNLKDSEHTIILDKINIKTIELDVFLFLETKHNPYYTFISLKQNSQIDFERDGEKDLLVKLISFDEKKAIIEFRNLNVNEKNKFEFIFNFVYYIIGGIILIIVLFLIYFKLRKNIIDKENAGTGI